MELKIILILILIIIITEKIFIKINTPMSK